MKTAAPYLLSALRRAMTDASSSVEDLARLLSLPEDVVGVRVVLDVQPVRAGDPWYDGPASVPGGGGRLVLTRLFPPPLAQETSPAPGLPSPPGCDPEPQ